MNATKLFWKVGSPIPEELSKCPDLFASSLVPRMLAWFTVDHQRVALLEGYSGGSYTPPSLFFAASALPQDFVHTLRQTKRCTLSMATIRDPPLAFQKAATTSWSQRPTSYTLEDLGLEAAKPKENYPSAIATSPIHMHCSLENYVPLENEHAQPSTGNFDESSEAMIVLLVESFVISGSILSPPTEAMKKRPGVVAKIDAQLIQPVVSVGHGGKICPLKAIHSMPRPVKSQDTTTTTNEGTETANVQWSSTDFDLAETTLGPGGFDTVEWNFREHGGTSPLGYNAITALVMPRPIGWISTFYTDDTTTTNNNNNESNDDSKLTHLAPYSFFCNVSRSLLCPVVAFSGFQKNGEIPKDAQNDAQQTGFFSYNMVTEDLAVPMNLSAAELPRDQSEFALAGLEVGDAAFVNAPIVKDSPIHLECQYIRSVPIGSFCLVLGRVVGIDVSTSVVTDKQIDVAKLKAITRLGFMDEYGTLDITS